MFYKKKNIDNTNVIENIKDFEPQSDFIEKNILIPVITEQVETISTLFNKMREIYNQLQNQNSEESQRYIKDFEWSIKNSKMKLGIQSNSVSEEAKKYREMLLNGIDDHLTQYTDALKKLGEISSEDDIKNISEYMINVRKFMFNIMQLKNKILSIILPMTTLETINRKTGEVIQRLHLESPEGKVTKIGLLPFETILDEIASFCDNGIKSIDSWFEHLKNKRIQYLETVVNQSKVQAAQEQAKAAKWTFFVQLGFIVLSFSFVVASFCLSEYKKDWIDFFTNKQSISKTLVEKNILPKQPSTNEKVKKMEQISISNKEKKLKEVPPINKDKVQK